MRKRKAFELEPRDETFAPVDWRAPPVPKAMFDRLSDPMTWQRLPPVILFEGRQGIGKRGLAAALAVSSKCESKSSFPCGECVPCRQWLRGEDPESLWLDPEGAQIKLPDVEMFQEHLDVKAAQGDRCICLLDIERLNIQAANRLLKTLEEPPARVRVLMTTSHPQRVMGTVLSRCVRIKVRAESGAGLEPQSTEPSWGSILGPDGDDDFGAALDRAERELNAFYRGIPADARYWRRAYQRRHVLRRARRLTVGAKIALNRVLVSEAVALVDDDS